MRLRRKWLALLVAWMAAAAVALAAEPVFRFVALSDPHLASGAEMVRFRQFLHTVGQTEKPDFVLMLGDVCGHAPEYLPRAKEVADASGTTVYTLPGNHDDNYGRNPQWYKSVFGRMHYSFEHKGMHFVMNCSQDQPIDWVEADLAAVGKDTPVVFCQHYPPAMKDDQGRQVADTLQKYPQVKLILSGHTHGYAEGTLGQVPSITLRDCNFSPDLKDPGNWYLCEV